MNNNGNEEMNAPECCYFEMRKVSEKTFVCDMCGSETEVIPQEPGSEFWNAPELLRAEAKRINELTVKNKNLKKLQWAYRVSAAWLECKSINIEEVF